MNLKTAEGSADIFDLVSETRVLATNFVCVNDNKLVQMIKHSYFCSLFHYNSLKLSRVIKFFKVVNILFLCFFF